MKILVIGNPGHFQECKEKFGEVHTYAHVQYYQDIASHSGIDAVFDFLIGDHPNAIAFHDRQVAPVFLNTIKVSLAKLFHGHPIGNRELRFGFCGLPTLFNRSVLEVSLNDGAQERSLNELCSKLGSAFQIVDDRVGLITPRVICMIINEAYYTVQEKTASREDIDVAMKLGTNYPFGPFEWCRRIGIKDVYETLDAVYADTKDERYKICPLLKTEYLRSVNLISAP